MFATHRIAHSKSVLVEPRVCEEPARLKHARKPCNRRKKLIRRYNETKSGPMNPKVANRVFVKENHLLIGIAT